MIFNIKGTSGSGKTTVVRQILDWANEQEELLGSSIELIYSDTNKLRGYHYPKLKVVVIGQYKTPCGGCDSISKYDECFELIDKWDKDEEYVVVYEGLRQSGDSKRILWLKERGHTVHVISLDTPLETCLASVADRRAARGVTEPLNPRNTVAKHNAIMACCIKLAGQGVTVENLSRSTAAKRILEFVRKP